MLLFKQLFQKKSSVDESSSHAKQANKENPRSKNASRNKSQQKRRRSKKPPQVEWDISQFIVPEVEGKTRFHDLGLELPLMHAIADLGFEYCSPIQAQSLPNTLNGHDMLGKAQTGTGKTAAFLTAIVDDLLKNPLEGERYAGEARALVIAPTQH